MTKKKKKRKKKIVTASKPILSGSDLPPIRYNKDGTVKKKTGPKPGTRHRRILESGEENQRVGTMFRLWADDLQAFKAQLVLDETNSQKVMEAWIKSYIRGNRHLRKIVEAVRGPDDCIKKRYSVQPHEAEEVMRRLQQLSPLKDIDVAFESFFSEDDKIK